MILYTPFLILLAVAILAWVSYRLDPFNPNLKTQEQWLVWIGSWLLLITSSAIFLALTLIDYFY